ncbi:hypothetical protein B5S32_g2547 [[Candida] boidinii]|nr:hypothetical protein B5S32_g2547 [[Candida] boidinii]
MGTTREYSADQFQLYEQLGKGAFGVVYRAIDKVTKQDVAVKQIDLESSDEIKDIQQEIAILANCNHPNITKYHGCFLKNFKLWIIMEYLGGGSCHSLLSAGPFSEDVIAVIVNQVIHALVYLHAGGKIHRDIKAANLLISDQGDVKIADFGVATQLSNNLSKRNTVVGTPYWMPPEIICQKKYNNSADVWSLGITAIEMAYGLPPLSQYPPMQAIFRIADGEQPSLGSGFSEEFNDFVNTCLQRDPTMRPSVRQLLNHKFVERGARVSKTELVKCVEKKRQWDIDTDNNLKEYYVPSTRISNNHMNNNNNNNFSNGNGKVGNSNNNHEGFNISFDLGTVEIPGNNNYMDSNSNTLKENNNFLNINNTYSKSGNDGFKHDRTNSASSLHGYKENKRLLNNRESTIFDKNEVLKSDLNNIFESSINKISRNNKVTETDVENFQDFRNLFVNSIKNENTLHSISNKNDNDLSSEDEDNFAKYFQIFLKKLMKSKNTDLKQKYLPKYYLDLEKQVLENKQKQKLESGELRSRDDVEELLLTRWAESVVDRWSGDS